MPRRSKETNGTNGAANMAISIGDVTKAAFPDGVPTNKDGSVSTDAEMTVEEVQKVGAVTADSAQKNKEVAKKIHRKLHGETGIRWGESYALDVYDNVKKAFPVSSIMAHVQQVDPQQVDYRPFPLNTVRNGAEFYERISREMHKSSPAARYKILFKEGNGPERGTGYLNMPDTTIEQLPPLQQQQQQQQASFPPVQLPQYGGMNGGGMPNGGMNGMGGNMNSGNNGYPFGFQQPQGQYAQPQYPQPQYPQPQYAQPQYPQPQYPAPQAPTAHQPEAQIVQPVVIQQPSPDAAEVYRLSQRIEQLQSQLGSQQQQLQAPQPQQNPQTDPRLYGAVATTFEELKETKQLVYEQQRQLAVAIGALQEMQRAESVRASQPIQPKSITVDEFKAMQAAQQLQFQQQLAAQAAQQQQQPPVHQFINMPPMPPLQTPAPTTVGFGAHVPMSAPAEVQPQPQFQPQYQQPQYPQPQYQQQPPQYQQQPQGYPPLQQNGYLQQQQYQQPQYPQPQYQQQPPQYQQALQQQQFQVPPGAPQPARGWQPQGMGAPPQQNQQFQPQQSNGGGMVHQYQQQMQDTVSMITGITKAVSEIKRAVGANKSSDDDDEYEDDMPPNMPMAGGFGPPPPEMQKQPFNTMPLGMGENAAMLAYNEDGSPNMVGTILGNAKNIGPWFKGLGEGVSSIMKAQQQAQQPQPQMPQYQPQQIGVGQMPQQVITVQPEPQYQPPVQRPFQPRSQSPAQQMQEQPMPQPQAQPAQSAFLPSSAAIRQAVGGPAQT